MKRLVLLFAVVVSVSLALAMRQRPKFPRAPGGRQNAQHGYILLTLVLFVALMAIAATAVVPMITFQIRREREEEMIHRGVQYSRAVRRYFKKFGRFPTRIEELESTNNMRFLRKRYKDPITGQDFKVLHVGDVKLSFGPGANVQSNTNLNPTPSPTGNSSPASNNAQGAGGDAPSPGTFGTPGNPSSGRVFSGPTFGGGPIVGVVSTSETESIREFNKKNHYNEWQFVYDPGSDRGGLLNTPAQPPLQSATQTEQSVFPGAPGGIQTVPGQISPQVQPAPSSK